MPSLPPTVHDSGFVRGPPKYRRPCNMFYVYVLANQRGNLYSGYTNDLKRRVTEHQNKKVYTTSRIGGDWNLIYYEACRNKHDALRRERYLKSGRGKEFLAKRIKYDLNS